MTDGLKQTNKHSSGAGFWDPEQSAKAIKGPRFVYPPINDNTPELFAITGRDCIVHYTPDCTGTCLIQPEPNHDHSCPLPGLRCP